MRLFFTVATLYKSRMPHGSRLTLLVDETGQLGRFEALLRAFTFARGDGVRAWAVFQDIGQITRNFGGDALQYGATSDVLVAPRKSYTRELFAAIPRLAQRSQGDPATRSA